MVAPRKYPDELRERAVRMVLDAKQDPTTRTGACRRIGQQLGINPETLRGLQVDEAVGGWELGDRPGQVEGLAQSRVASPVVGGQRLALGCRVLEGIADRGREELRVAERVGDPVAGHRIPVVPGVATSSQPGLIGWRT